MLLDLSSPGAAAWPSTPCSKTWTPGLRRRGPASPTSREMARSSSLPQMKSVHEGAGHLRAQSTGALHRSKTGGLLGGVSTSAEALNAQSQQDLLRLLGECRGEASLVRSTVWGKEGSRPVDDHGKGGATSDSFADLLDDALERIAALRRTMDNFDPKGNSGLRNSPSPLALQRGRAGDPGMSREDAEQLRGRLEAYKMGRRAEPDLPPLQPSPPKTPKKQPETDILLRNASPEALRRQSLDSKKLQLHKHAQLQDLRIELAVANRVTIVDARAHVIQKKLEQKTQQGARAVAMRRKNQPKLQQDGRDLRKDQMLEKWSTACVVGAFARQLLEELRVRRMSDKERMEYMARTGPFSRMHGPNASRFIQNAVVQSQSIQEMHSAPSGLARLSEVATRLQYQMRRHRKQSQASCIVACLQAWRVAGRTFVTLKQFARRVVKMQQWWRRMSAHLQEVRDKVAKRWERLEMEPVERELSKAGRRHRAVVDPRAAPDDRAKVTRTPEDIRNRFVEYELRARRYALLPAILCWEEDVAQWRTNWLRWMEEREAHCALGLEGTVVVPMPVTTWPPVRPSHLPCAHLPQEVTRNCECPHWCPGRKGDEEILDMLRRCRASPGMHSGWTKVGVGQPRRGSGSSSRASGGAVQRDSNGCAEEFAVDSEPVEEEELRQWGCNADRLPGASKGPPARPSKDQ